MARADTPPLTHYSPPTSEHGLPVTPGPESPPRTVMGVESGHAGLWGCGSGAGFMAAPHSPPMRTMSMSMGTGIGNNAPEPLGLSMHENMGKHHAARAVAVDDDVIDDDVESDGPLLHVNKRRAFNGLKTRLPVVKSICTTFIMPRLEEKEYSAWAVIHYHIQQYFVYDNLPLTGIFHSYAGRTSRIQIVTPKSIQGSFEDTVKSICKQVTGLNYFPIRLERGQWE